MRPHGPAGAFYAAPLLLLLGLSLLAAGCSMPRYDVLEKEGSARSVVLISGLRHVSPPDPALIAQLSPMQLEQSLRRLVVRVSTWVSFILGDPQPLLSGEQIQWVLGVLHPRLLQLQPDQRLELNFKDRFKGLQIQMQVYPDGSELVFRFLQLVSDPPEPGMLTRGEMPVHRAQLFPQAGQKLTYDEKAVSLHEPLAAAQLESAAELQSKMGLLDSALKNSVALPEEEKTLRALIQDHPNVSIAAWKLYWDKRATLATARSQGLFSTAEYEQRKQSLLKELGL